MTGPLSKKRRNSPHCSDLRITYRSCGHFAAASNNLSGPDMIVSSNNCSSPCTNKPCTDIAQQRAVMSKRSRLRTEWSTFGCPQLTQPIVWQHRGCSVRGKVCPAHHCGATSALHIRFSTGGSIQDKGTCNFDSTQATMQPGDSTEVRANFYADWGESVAHGEIHISNCEPRRTSLYQTIIEEKGAN